MPEITVIKKNERTHKKAAYFFLIFFFSCISVNENLYDVKRIDKKTSSNNIEISYLKPEKKHIIIGELSIRYNAGYKKGTAIQYLQNAAAGYGADGIIINSIKQSDDKWSVSHAKGEQSVNMSVETYVLSCLMYQYLE